MKRHIDTELSRFNKETEAYWDAWEFYVASHSIPMPSVARGEALDVLGRLFALTRKFGESDYDFRSRIRLSFDLRFA